MQGLVELESVGGYILPDGTIGPMHKDGTPDLFWGAQTCWDPLCPESMQWFKEELSVKDQTTILANYERNKAQ